MSDQTATIKGITKQLEAIRDERMPYANTATRIGEAMLSLLSLYLNTPYVKKEGEQRLVIGDIYLSWDKENNAVKVSKADGSAANFYAVGGISAFGAGSMQGGGGSGMSYERLDNWADYSVDKATAVLSAFLGNDLNERLKKVEGGALTSVDWSIIKNKPTSMPASDVPAWAKAVTKPSYAWNEITGKPNEFNPAMHSHSFASLTDKPNTLQGYGITDAKIAGGTITLGTGAITPLTVHQAIYALTLQKNGVAIGSFNPKSANATLNITVPTKLSQLTDDIVSGKYLPLNSNAVSATKLKDSRLIWGQNFDGTKNIDGPLTIGDIKISYDEAAGALALTRVSGSDKKANLYATGGLTAFGAGSAQGGGGSGISYERLDRWGDYTTAKAAAVLSAFLGNDLNERLKKVEGGALTSVDWSIIRNKPTSMPASDVPAWAKAATKPSYAWNEITGKPNEFNPAAHSHTFASLLNKPTTLQGYGITDAASISHTHAFSQLRDKPTTVDGYGIVDTFKTHREVNFAPDEAGYYAVMTTKTGIDEMWRHVISMDWSKNDSVNWISQLALPTHQNESVYYRKNEAVGKLIKDAKWIRIWDEKNLTKLSQLTDDVVSGKYLSLAGGTMQNTSMIHNLNSEFVGGKHYSKILTSDGKVTQLSLDVSTEGGAGGGYRCISKSKKVYPWSINKLIFAMISRHKGVGFITLLFRVNHALSSYDADIRATGSFNDIVNALQFYYNANTGIFSIWAPFNDFDYTKFITVLEESNITLNGDNNYYPQLPSDVGTLLKCEVNSATKLEQTRKIWGQDFDGTGNVTGELSSVTNIDNLLHFAGNNVGIGTNSPVYKLDVNGNMRISDELFVNSFLYLANNKGLCLKDKEGSNQRALFISSSNTVYFGCNDRPLYTLFEGDELQFNVYNKGWQNALVISRDRTAIFTGNVLAQGGVTAYTTSDRRLKANIKQVDSMRIIRSLGGTWQFDYKDTGKHGIGFIAQSVKGSVLRNMVYTDADGYMKLNYLDTRLIALALGAAVQVDDKVERLKKRIKVLEKEIEKLKGGEK